MLSEHVSVDRSWADAESAREMEAEAQGVEVGAAAQHTIMARQTSGEVSERIRRIGNGPVDRASRLLVDASRYDNHRGLREIAVVARMQLNGRVTRANMRADPLRQLRPLLFLSL